jgi:hypothetical protein
MQVEVRNSDGREAASNNFTLTFTNLDTGTSVVHQSTYHVTITYPADGTIVEVWNGVWFESFKRGDQGPYGQVGRGAQMYFIDGTFTKIYDPKADVVTSFSGVGQVIDACELLSA